VAVRWNATDANYIAETSHLPNEDTYTFCFWMRIVSGAAWRYPWTFEGYNSVGLETNGGGTQIVFRDAGSSTNIVDPGTGVWTFLAYRRDGTTARDFFHSTDGVTLTKTSVNGSTLMYGSSSSWTIGHGPYSNGAPDADYAAHKVWSNAALGDDEIYNEMLHRLPVRTANLHYWLQLESGATANVDHSGNGYDFTLNGTLATADGPPYLQWAAPAIEVVSASSPSGAMTVAADGAATLAATMTGVGAVAVSAAGAATLAATVGGVGSVAVTAAGSSSLAATATGTGAIAVAAAGTSTLSATVGGTGAVSVAAAGASSLAATVGGTGAVSTTMSGAAALSATATGVGSVSAALGGSSSLSATMTDGLAGSFTASAAGSSSLTATMTGVGAVVVAASGSATLAATVGGVGAVSVSAAGSSALAATATGLGSITAALGGTSSLAATVTAGASGAFTAAMGGTSALSATMTGVGSITVAIVGTSSLAAVFGEPLELIRQVAGVLMDGSIFDGIGEEQTRQPQHIEWPRTDTGYFEVAITRQNFQAADLTGGSVVMALKKRLSRALLWEKDAEITDASGGTARFTVSEGDVDALADRQIYIYDIHYVDASAQRWQVIPVSRFVVAPVVVQEDEP
jgi:hypothetical protein